MTLGLRMMGVAAAMVAASAWGQSVQAPEGMKERGNLRDARYCELLIVKGNLLKAKAAVYNTIGLNDCPPDQWKSLDVAKIKQQFRATEVVMNGPRHFMMDRNALKAPGATESIQGMPMRLLAYLEVSPAMQKRNPYTENMVERQTQYVYEKGRAVYELLAPDHRVYILQSYSQELDPSLNEAGLAGLGTRLKLPKGWHFRVRKLDADLVVRNNGTKAYVLQDDLRNSYQRM